MKNSSSSHYNSNPSLIDDLQQTTNVELDDESTYSFRRELSKLRTAKSHGELYQPIAPLPLPILTKLSMNSTDQPTPTPSVVPQVVPQASATQKIPIWKRFKKIITPTKKNKDQTNSNSSMKIPPLILSEMTNADEILQNPLKISDLRTWLTTKNFPEQRIRDEYEVKIEEIDRKIRKTKSFFVSKEITNGTSSSKKCCTSTGKSIEESFQRY